MESARKNNTQRSRLSIDRLLPKIRTIISLNGTWFYRLTHWETWDWRIKYIIIAPAWLWFCLRARSPWFFTAANPTLTFGGFEGESKKEMYAQLPPDSYPKSIYISPALTFAEVQKLAEPLGFPIAVKPDVGKMGFMFRRIPSLSALQQYHEKIQCHYIIQEFADYPLEISVFYYRTPGDKKGTITGFIRKEYLEVTGDGQSTLWQLISNYPRVQFRLEEMKTKHRANLHRVIPAAQKYCLSPALNLSRGGKLVSVEQEIDDRLLKIFDNLSHYGGNFYYGRYDIKCSSIHDLKEGKNFSILEYNGSGAEPHHVYGNGYSLFQACSILVAHWQMLYRVARENHRRGVSYWGFTRGWRFMKHALKNIKTLKELDEETELA
jgi:hypothetical protein